MNKKIITISRIGFNAPIGANWAYGIWKVDLIDTNSKYCMSYTTKENFGGDSRFCETLKEYTIIETKQAYTKTGLQKITGISSLPILDSDDFIDTIKEWLNK